MPGIFISYRHADTQPWAVHLSGDLREAFGASQVFMDINGSIPPGADFEQVLESALSGCDALLALIGPNWLLCKEADRETRSLDLPEDWVRREIATALRRNIPVVPVLFGGASLPGKTELPEELHSLGKREAAKMSDDRWDYDIGELIKGVSGVSKLTPLRPRDAVRKSTCRQVDKLALFKLIHDALHAIEFGCLRPMQAGGMMCRVRPFKIKLAEQALRIQTEIRDKGWNGPLHDDLMDRLGSATEALEAAVAAPGEVAYGLAISELIGLLGMAPQLDAGIQEAAAGLDGFLDLDPVVQDVDTLSRLRNDLNQRVSEHGRLQRLDLSLRTVCVGEIAPGMLAREWTRILLVRSRLVPPFSPELAKAKGDLVAIEGEIGTGLAQGDEAAALDLVKEYFQVVITVFKAVDSSLTELSQRLSNSLGHS